MRTTRIALLTRRFLGRRVRQLEVEDELARLRGFFANDRRWDIVPDGRAY